MEFDDAAGDIEAEAGAAFILRHRRVGVLQAPELSKQSRHVFGRDSRTVVDDPSFEHPVFLLTLTTLK